MPDQPYPPIQARELMNPLPGHTRQAWQAMPQDERERLIIESRQAAEGGGVTGARSNPNRPPRIERAVGPPPPRGAPAEPSGNPDERSVAVERMENVMDAPADFIMGNRPPARGGSRGSRPVDPPLPPNQRRRKRQ